MPHYSSKFSKKTYNQPIVNPDFVEGVLVRRIPDTVELVDLMNEIKQKINEM
jgi:hypothetical protein